MSTTYPSPAEMVLLCEAEGCLDRAFHETDPRKAAAARRIARLLMDTADELYGKLCAIASKQG